MKTRSPSPLRRAAFLLTVCLTASALAQESTVPIPAPGAAPSAAAPAKAPRQPEDASKPESFKMNYHTKFMKQKAIRPIDLLFLGDSITDFWPKHGAESWAKFAPYHPMNFGVSGITTSGVIWNITNGELDGLKPKVTVIMIGTNNAGRTGDKPEWLANGIKKIVEIVHEKMPETKVLLLGIFPRSGKNDGRQKTCAATNAILAATDFGPNTRYLDIGKVFMDEKGNANRKLMPDALHPNAEGYNVWHEAMIPVLSEMMK